MSFIQCFKRDKTHGALFYKKDDPTHNLIPYSHSPTVVMSAKIKWDKKTREKFFLKDRRLYQSGAMVGVAALVANE